MNDDNDDGEESLGTCEDEDDGLDPDDDSTSGYNPDTLPPKNVEWITVCRCLALDMRRFETDGVGKAFVSGHGSPDGMGYFNVHERGSGKTHHKHTPQ